MKVLKTLGLIGSVLALIVICFSIPALCTPALYERLGISMPDLLAYLINVVFGLLLLTFAVAMIRQYSISRAEQLPVMLKEGVFESVIKATEKISKGEFNIELNHPKTRNEAEKLSGELTNAINKMAMELKKIDEMRRMFISDVSHEIQSPLTSIRGFAKALRIGNMSDEEKLRYLTIIEEESLRLSRLSDNLLRLASLEAETIEYNPLPYRLDSQIVDMVLSCEPLWREKELVVETELDKVTVRADKELLSQVWLNLLYNSIKFTPNGGKIILYLRELTDKVEFKIVDTGTGITDADKKRIFERFYKADRSRNRANQGSGLGLTISNEIIKLHKGDIRVEDNQPSGTIFIVTLPK